MALISIYADVSPLTTKQVYIQQQPLYLSEIVDVIRDGGGHGIADFTPTINTIRTQPKAETARLKASLHSFTAAAKFTSKKGVKEPHQYTSYMVLDIDGLTQAEVLDAKHRLIDWGFCHAAFISPSGKGVKAIVQFVNSTSNKHSSVFSALRYYMDETFKLELDPSGQDISRLCYFSYDPLVHYDDCAPTLDANELLEKYKPLLLTTPGYEQGVVIDESRVNTASAISTFNTFVAELVDKGEDSSEGKRNSFLLALTRLKAYNMVAADVIPLAIEWITNNGLPKQYDASTIREKITYNFAHYYKHYNSALLPTIKASPPTPTATSSNTPKSGYLSDELDTIHAKLLQQKTLFIDAPTGSGKTSLVRLLAKKMGVKVDLLMPTRALVQQQANGKVLHGQGSIATIVGSKQLQSEHYNADVLAACYPAIKKLKGRKATVLVIDEVHSLVSDYGWKSDVVQTIANYLSRYDYVIGLSGSMFPLNGLLTSANYMRFVNPRQMEYEYNFMTLAKERVEDDGTVIKAIRERDYFIDNIKPDRLNVLYMNDKRELLKIQKTLQNKGLKVLLITKDAVDSKDYDFQAAYTKLIEGQKLIGVDVLLTTCLIQAGVNINNQYDEYNSGVLGNKKGVNITFAKSSTLVDIIQFTARFRNCAPFVSIIHDQQMGKKRTYNTQMVRENIELKMKAYRETDKQFSHLAENEIKRKRINNVRDGVMLDANGDYAVDEYYLLYGQLKAALYNTAVNVAEMRTVLAAYHFCPTQDYSWIGNMGEADAKAYGLYGKQLRKEKKETVAAIVAELAENKSVVVHPDDTLRQTLAHRMDTLLRYFSQEEIAAKKLMTDINFKQFKRSLAFVLIELDKANEIQLPADVRKENELFNQLKSTLKAGITYTSDELKAKVAAVPALGYSEGKYLSALKVMYNVKTIYQRIDKKKMVVGYELTEIKKGDYKVGMVKVVHNERNKLADDCANWWDSITALTIQHE